MDGKRLVKTLSSAPVAQGRTAEIYVWDDRHILKLYRDWCPSDWVDYEARIARAVYEAGIPSPKAGEIVEVDGRRGMLYERLEGISMVQDLKARPWMLFSHGRSLAELQIQIHQKSTAELPTYKDRLHYDIRETSQLTDELRRKSLNLLDQLPNGQNVCHGDYHPENVLITREGPVVIDWMTACSGSPWADVARTSLILTVGARAAGKQIPLILRIMVRLYHRTYLHRYCSLRADTENELDRWTAVIAAARLSENIIPEREALIRIVEQA
jgi:uncharacterized protein (TIGR02172 family)